MKTGYEAVYPIAPREIPVPYMQPPAFTPEERGLSLRDHITITLMAALVSRMDSGLFNPDELADHACRLTDSLVARMK